MRRVPFGVMLLALATAGTASAQERVAGTGRIEVNGFPGGGTFFTKGYRGVGPSFKDYALGTSATVNLTRRLGVEGEIGGGVGVKQSFQSSDVDQTTVRIKGPNTLAYNANLVYAGKSERDRPLVPYATAGIGGLTLFSRSELEPLGLARNATFFTGNFGGGLKWFSHRHWGARGDYRFMIVNGKDTSPSFFGLNDTRYGHRVYGSLLYTFGR